MQIPTTYNGLPVVVYSSSPAFMNKGRYENGTIYINRLGIADEAELDRTLAHEFLHHEFHKKHPDLIKWVYGMRLVYCMLLFVLAWVLLPSLVKPVSLVFLMPAVINVSHEAEVLYRTRDFGYGILKIGLILVGLSACLTLLVVFY